MRKRIICVRQHDVTDCGAACLSTVAKCYGLNVHISKIREIAGTDKYGTNTIGMVKAAEALGFSAKAVKGNCGALNNSIPLPCIAHVFINKTWGHYIVIHRIYKKHIIVADPGKGIVKYSIDDFSKIWSGMLLIMAPSNSYAKIKDKESSFESFAKLLIPQWKFLVFVSICSLITTLISVISPFYFKYIMDEVGSFSLEKSLQTVSVALIFLYLIYGFMSFSRSYLIQYISQRIDIPLVLGFYRHVIDLPMSFFGSRRTGEIVSRFIDASEVREILSGAALTIVIDSVLALVGATVLFNQNHTLFYIALINMFVYAVTVFVCNPVIKKQNEKIMEQNSKVNSFLFESINGIETIKAYNSEIKVNNEMDSLYVNLLSKVFKIKTIYNISQTLTTTISLIGEVIVLWTGMKYVLSDQMTLGQLITFNALLAYFTTPLQNLINLQPNLQKARVAVERVNEIFHLPKEKDINTTTKVRDISFMQNIRFENVVFRYGTRTPVLNKTNIVIEPGSRTAIIGESGSGKTTLAKLLMRFYDTESGDIHIGNYNIKDISTDYLRDKIAYVSQDVFIFDGSIKENIIYGNSQAELADVIEACHLSNADEFIDKLPARYDTPLFECGSNLSGGQRQRIALARALIKKPEVIILDEATSNLDSLTEKEVSKTIEQLSNKMTVIIIAHRLSTIKSCDQIYLMKNGEVIEHGTHKELIAAGHEYCSLWNCQILDTVEERE